MTTTVRKIEYLSIIYKAIQLTEWSQSYTQYRVADSAVCDALNWALQYPAESGVASDLDDGEVVIVGKQFRIKVTPPASQLGFKVYEDKTGFLKDNPTGSVSDFFVMLDAFFSKDQNKPNWFSDYQAALELVSCLKKAAVHYQGTQIIFVDNKKKLELPVLMDGETLNGFSKAELSKLLNFLREESLHGEQKYAIFADTVTDLIKLEPLDNRFNSLLRQLEKLYQKMLHSYNLFCADFSYEKFKEKLAASRLDDFTKAHKIFSDIQNQILGIPAATFIVATQMKQVANGYASPEFWANSGILLGCVIYAVLMLCTLNNQSETASVINNEISRQKNKIKKELGLNSELPKDIQDLFSPLDIRIKNQQNVIYFLQWIVSLGLFACIIAYAVQSF